MSSIMSHNLKSQVMKTKSKIHEHHKNSIMRVSKLAFLLAAGLLLGAVTTTQAQSRYGNERDMRHDRVDIRHDRQDMRFDRDNMARDRFEGNGYAYRHDRRDLIHDRRDLRYDRHDLYRDRCF